MPKYSQEETILNEEVTFSFLKDIFDSLPKKDKLALRRMHDMFPATRGLGFNSFLELVFRTHFALELSELDRRIGEKARRDIIRSALRTRPGAM